ncbi:MAG: hypothetical protein K0R38_4589 [Polyangiaceae bacterium]|nr:hypothetical protein [Polyangiaceae bacterium]
MDQRHRIDGPAAAVRVTATDMQSGARWPSPLRYLAELTTPRQVLWCYLIWWGFVLVRYFDPSLGLWLSSLGISVIIGTGLYLSTAHGGRTRTALEPWQIARLYMMPFCVSSFAALIKGHGFLLVFDPSLQANVVALLSCAAFVGCAALARRWAAV